MAHDHSRTFKDDDFQYGYEIALGAEYHRRADAGEVAVTAGRIKNGDRESWVREWLALADSVATSGRDAANAGHEVSGVAYLRRAATYYSTALYAIAGTEEAENKLDIWRRGRSCWEQVVDLMGAERVEIPYEGTTLPGFFFRAADAAPGEQRPLVVLNNGSDGATSSMWSDGGAGAGERGYHWLAFDGPGQQAALFEQGLFFRPDWEAVLTPVVDAMTARDDVDSDRLAVIGISQGGFWVPRALCFEHRFAAAVADPGVVDVGTSWRAPLPKSMVKHLEAGEKDKFDKEMALGEKFSKSTRAVLEFRGEPFGIQSGSRYDLYEAIAPYALGDEVQQIDTPLLITEPEGEQFWPGQSQELLDRISGEKELVRFSAAEGGGRHCEPMARGLRDARIYDWLDGYLR